MARNKHPEETVAKILDIAHTLFLQKGYDQTSMQDIVDALKMSKGAIYHHFHSKEDLLIRMLERDYDQHQHKIEELLKDQSLTGLQRIRSLLHWELTAPMLREQSKLALPIYQNPKIIVQEMYNLIEYGAPQLSRLIEQGNQDGSLSVKFPYETAETLQLLFNFIFYPQLIRFTRDEFIQRILFLQEMCNKLGLPVIDDVLREEFVEYYDVVFNDK